MNHSLRTQPAIAGIAVVGARSVLGHDELVVHAITRPDARLDTHAFFGSCNRVLPGFMVPRFPVRQAGLPKTATLRIDMYKLQPAGLAGAVDRQQPGVTPGR